MGSVKKFGGEEQKKKKILNLFITLKPAYFKATTSINVSMIYISPNYSHHPNLKGG